MPHPKGYSRLQIALHWVIAALVLIQLTLNSDMQQAFAQRLATGTIPANAGAIFHAVLGMLVLVLATIRLSLRIVRGTPEPEPQNSALINVISLVTHYLLYGFLFLMPITGMIAWFAGVETAGVLHELGRLVLIPAILLHIAGAVVEELVLNNRVLRKMLRPDRC